MARTAFLDEDYEFTTKIQAETGRNSFSLADMGSEILGELLYSLMQRKNTKMYMYEISGMIKRYRVNNTGQ